MQKEGVAAILCLHLFILALLLYLVLRPRNETCDSSCQKSIAKMVARNTRHEGYQRKKDGSCCGGLGAEEVEALKECYATALPMKTFHDVPQGLCGELQNPAQAMLAIPWAGLAGSSMTFQLNKKLCERITEGTEPVMTELCGWLDAMSPSVFNSFRIKYWDLPDDQGAYVLMPNKTPRFLVVVSHGGGWVSGAASSAIINLSNHGYMDLRSEQEDVLWVFVDYGNSPMYRYEQQNRAVLGAYKKAKRLYSTIEKTISWGDSAGGGLAAALALRVADKSMGQFLSSPCLAGDWRDWAELKSWTRPYVGAFNPALSNESMAFYWGAHSQRVDQPDYEDPQVPRKNGEVDYLYSPYNVPDSVVKKCGPICVVEGGLDILVDEGLEYAKRFSNLNGPSSAKVVVIENGLHDDITHEESISAYRDFTNSFFSLSK